MKFLGSDPLAPAPLGGTRQQAIQRLQVGLIGLLLMVLLVGLAGIIREQVAQTDETAVPQAAGSDMAGDVPKGTEPLSKGGIVPEIGEQPQVEASAAATEMATTPETVEDATADVEPER